MKCIKGLEVQVLRSAAGYYIGTVEEDDGMEMPNCRISTQYYKKESEAQAALDNKTFIPRIADENIFCSNGRGCQIK